MYLRDDEYWEIEPYCKVIVPRSSSTEVVEE